MLDLLGADLADLENLTNELNLPRFRAKQLFHWVHRQGVTAIGEMSNIPGKLQEILSEKAFITRPKLITTSKSKKGDTIKFLLKFSDGVMVETVLMTYERTASRDRNTVCVSTQAGCAMGCVFCATGMDRMERNLTAGEIMAQVWTAQRYCREYKLDQVTNVVYMGMGEPLANLPVVLKSIHLLNHPEGLGIGMRRMTISTCGLVPQIYQLADAALPVTLAVSLHAPDNEGRSSLMPINKKYPLEEVLKAADYYAEKTGRRVTYEYALFRGVNDSEEDGAKLCRLMHNRLANVNIIPSNEVPESGFQSPEPEVLAKFVQKLAACGVNAVVREEKGGDINAACGQLRRRIRGK
ncbi:23S rRNA (adenine(2503)-C(2))-methyltransferase RlmN [Dehalobacterium formicoaceticum]|uniref:Probable dual-specificity RNA methyltransferase RlmN n=1 Tax=Dehalobacterium formicoaceticum TaxID=51515 RepID=A0ABT1Y198_9FIRM|nr:23S rRNA (adenine(2503)-C(2))-methyltransferase RlmN [Dehalobacterium formicoaceticum]MCR6544642.1 23S rRNA (adenine(2503)-C(2))-methyltransferase RlmN [Dehalobacterium formicoaceticum]